MVWLTLSLPTCRGRGNHNSTNSCNFVTFSSLIPPTRFDLGTRLFGILLQLPFPVTLKISHAIKIYLLLFFYIVTLCIYNWRESWLQNGKMLRTIKSHDVAIVCLNWAEDDPLSRVHYCLSHFKCHIITHVTCSREIFSSSMKSALINISFRLY
jgi:hypothetical protein